MELKRALCRREGPEILKKVHKLCLRKLNRRIPQWAAAVRVQITVPRRKHTVCGAWLFSGRFQLFSRCLVFETEIVF